MKSFEKIYEKVKNTLSEKRFYHSVCVMNRAIEYAKIYGEDEEKAKLAGLVHDIAKEVPKEKRVENAEKLGVNLDDIEKNNTGLIHAKAGAKIAETEFGLDKEICDAIAYHTTGKENMTTLQKIIYLADFTGIDRKFDDLDYLYKLCKEDLDKAMLYSLRKTILEKVDEEKIMHLDTVKAYNYYLKNS